MNAQNQIEKMKSEIKAKDFMIKKIEAENKAMQKTLIIEAGEIIRMYDKDLAEMWDNAAFSFQRLDMAYSFAAGFRKKENDEPHKMALVVIGVALKLRELSNKEFEMMQAA